MLILSPPRRFYIHSTVANHCNGSYSELFYHFVSIPPPVITYKQRWCIVLIFSLTSLSVIVLQALKTAARSRALLQCTLRSIFFKIFFKCFYMFLIGERSGEKGGQKIGTTL